MHCTGAQEVCDFLQVQSLRSCVKANDLNNAPDVPYSNEEAANLRQSFRVAASQCC